MPKRSIHNRNGPNKNGLTKLLCLPLKGNNKYPLPGGPIKLKRSAGFVVLPVERFNGWLNKNPSNSLKERMKL